MYDYEKNLAKRLKYRSGNFSSNPQSRIAQGKIRGLKNAIYNSENGYSFKLSNGKIFRGLLVADKDKPDYKNMILDMLFEDVPLNEVVTRKWRKKTYQGLEQTALQGGEVITWLGDSERNREDKHLLLYLRLDSETNFYRFEVRLCEKQITINGSDYWVWWRGPIETSIVWNQKGGIEQNDMNYSGELYITKNDETLASLYRFAEIKVDGNKWRVAVVNPDYGEGIIQVYLEETKNNTYEEAIQKEKESYTETETEINGDSTINAYSSATYTVDSSGGEWNIVDEPSYITITSQSDNEITLKSTTGRFEEFILQYIEEDSILEKTIRIKPF